MSLVRIVVLSVVGAALGLWGLESYLHYQRGLKMAEMNKYWANGPQLLSLENPPSPDSFQPMQVISEFPAIEEFEILTAENSAGKAEVVDDDLVLGVVLGDEIRAYPINMMTGPDREIFNDTLGGQPIAATW
jgi:hypothetical protein